MADLRTSIAKEISNVPRPKISKLAELSIKSPKLWDKTQEISVESPELYDKTPEIEISRNVEIYFEEARIPQPFCDVGSSVIPLKSYTSEVSLNPSLQMDLLDLNVHFHPISTYAFDSTVIYLKSYTAEVNLNPSSHLELLNLNVLFHPISTYVFNPYTRIDSDIRIFNVPFVPLTLNKMSIVGMNYADKHWHKILLDKDDSSAHENKKVSSKENGGVTSETKKRGRKPKNQQPLPSIWDLLFAVLQPPLTFGEMENLLLPHALYVYQVQGIKFLLDNEHALLADDMGTGKTVMTLVALKILIQQAKVHHVLILCPPSVLYEWKRHLDEWTPELIAYLIRGSQDVRKSLWDTPMHVYVTTYDTLRNDIDNDLFPKESFSFFDVVVLDEAHHIKNTKTKNYRAIKKLQPGRRWALTGTPIQNKIEDLASIFEFVYPGYLTSFDLYPERIQEKIKPYFLRRRKKDVMPELLPKTYEPIELELDEEQEVAYRLAEAGIRDELSALGNKVTKLDLFAKIMLLKQICNFAPKKSSSPKTNSIKERIEEIIQSGENEGIGSGNKVIVFSQFVDEGVSKLEKLLEPYGIAKIIGGQSDSARRSEIEKFKKRKDIPILIASVRSGGEGLNLTEASYVIHFDHWWNPAVMWQAEDRVHRRGQIKGVNVYSYWMKDTIDDRIRQKLREKGILFEQVIDGLAEDGIDQQLTTDDYLEILGVKKPVVSKTPIIDVNVWQSMTLSEIQQKLYEITPSDFERLVSELMHYLGYPNVKVTAKSHDGGIDVLSTRNTENGIERVAAQCKRYRGSVAVHTARDFFGAISNDQSIKHGFLVTTGWFTPECLQFCEGSGKIRAIQGLELARYVKQFGLRG